MDNRPESQSDDVWSEWLLHRRHADDSAYQEIVQGVVGRLADRVLDDAKLSAGMTLADIGAGEGLLAFRAIERVGPTLQVVLTDISGPMLRHAEGLAVKQGVRNQCRFLECSADKLGDIADSTVDVVATRAVLAYVADKSAALREFHRILKPGGRLSIAEPILQDEAFFVRALRRHLDAQAPRPPERFLALLHRWKAAQFPDTEEQCAMSPIVNYSERDLLNFVRHSGFTEIHLELHIDVTTSLINSWDVFVGTSPHPWAPTLGLILAEQFTAEERQFFEQVMRPIVESGKNLSTDRMVYLNAMKPIT
jgi:arsenite methyltransferase